MRALLAALALLALSSLAAAVVSASPDATPAVGDSSMLGAPVPCSWTAPDGTQFDFSGLTSSTGTKANGKNDDVFSINVCGVSQADGPTGTCASQNAMVCMQYTWSSAWFAIAKNDNTGTSYALTDATKGAAGGVTLSIQNGAYGPNAAKVDLLFVCGTSATDSYEPLMDPNTKNHWTVTITSTKACGQAHGGGGKKHGLSGGWAFIIFILCATTVYIVGGCLFKRHRQGTQGMESCPNIDFWREFPSLVKDGCRFTWGKVRQCTGRSQGSETYQEFK